MPAGSKWIQAYQSPKIECLVNQDCWWCSETGYADIILPACTNFERDDIGEFGNCGWMSPDTFSGNLRRVIVYMKKCIEPLYESKPDYWIYSQLAARLGMEQEYTEGRSEEEWIRKYYDWSDLHKMVSWEEFKEKGYYLVPIPERHLDACFAVVRRGARLRHPGPRQPQAGHRQSEGARHLQRQDRIRVGEPAGTQRRPFGAPPGAKVHPKLGRPRDGRALCPVPAATHLAASALFVPHDVRPHGVDLGHPGPPDAHRRLLLPDLPHQPGRCRGARHQRRRRCPTPQRPAPRGAVRCPRHPPGDDRGRYTRSNRRPSTTRSSRANPQSIDRAGCVNLLATDRQISKGIAGVAPNSTLVEITKWEGLRR